MAKKLIAKKISAEFSRRFTGLGDRRKSLQDSMNQFMVAHNSQMRQIIQLDREFWIDLGKEHGIDVIKDAFVVERTNASDHSLSQILPDRETARA